MKQWIPGLFSIAAAIVLLAVGGFGPPSGATTSRAASAAGRTGTQTLLAISCPSVIVCYAVGDRGAILATHDAGATWQRQSSGSTSWLLYPPAIDCPATSDCFVRIGQYCSPNGGAFLATTDSGTTWTRRVLPTACPGPGPSCPSVTTCYAFVYRTPLNPDLFRTSNSGRSWQDRGKTPDDNTYGPSTAGIGVHSVACSTVTVCYAGGWDQLARSSDGGKRWTRQFIRAAPCPTADFACHQIDLMACPGQRTCYAGGLYFTGDTFNAVAVATTDGFRTWRRSLIRGFHGLGALSCPGPTTCFALGGGFEYPFNPGSLNLRNHQVVTGSVNDRGRFAMTTDGGATWQVKPIAPYPFTGLACPSVSVCYAGGYLGRLMGSTDGGTTWRDLIPALFVSGSYRANQPLHTYSPWFTTSGLWQITLTVVPASGRLAAAIPHGCAATTNSEVTLYVRNAQGRVVAGPVHVPLHWSGPSFGGSPKVGTKSIQVTGRLRLDLVSRCSTFSARADAVTQVQG